MMDARRGRTAIFTFAALTGLALLACGEEDARWDMEREALGGVEAHLQQVDEEWALYRERMVQALDQMRSAVDVARGTGAVADRQEFDELELRIADVRRQAATKAKGTRDEIVNQRHGLRSAFAQLRTDVDAILTRLGHNPDDIARWQED